MFHPLIVYHKDCFDGVTAAWIVDRYFKRRMKDNPESYGPPELFGATYGEDPPDCNAKSLFIVDFSYPREVLERMAKVAAGILVLDHHKTAEEDLRGLPYAIFDMERSGAGITWDWFNVGQPRHWLVNCVEDRDLWRFKLPFTKAQMGYISTVPMNMDAWQALSILDPDDVARQGQAILRYIENYGKKAAEHVSYHLLGGEVFPIINIAYQNCSDHLDLLMTILNMDRAAYFFLHKNGKWQFGMKSRGDFDVSNIAKQYGGGGHKNAAGFMVNQLPWIETVEDVK